MALFRCLTLLLLFVCTLHEPSEASWRFSRQAKDPSPDGLPREAQFKMEHLDSAPDGSITVSGESILKVLELPPSPRKRIGGIASSGGAGSEGGRRGGAEAAASVSVSSRGRQSAEQQGKTGELGMKEREYPARGAQGKAESESESNGSVTLSGEAAVMAMEVAGGKEERSAGPKEIWQKEPRRQAGRQGAGSGVDGEGSEEATVAQSGKAHAEMLEGSEAAAAAAEGDAVFLTGDEEFRRMLAATPAAPPLDAQSQKGPVEHLPSVAPPPAPAPIHSFNGPPPKGPPVFSGPHAPAAFIAADPPNQGSNTGGHGGQHRPPPVPAPVPSASIPAQSFIDSPPPPPNTPTSTTSTDGGIPAEVIGPGSTGSSGSPDQTSTSDSSSLSAGAIAGIVIGCLAGVALLGVGVWVLMARRKNVNRAEEAALQSGPPSA